MTVAYRPALPADGPALSAMARESFVTTFGHLYRAADLDAFVAAAFGPAGLSAQLADPTYQVRVAHDGAAILGFAKLGPVVFPGEWRPGTVELYQLYVLAGRHGSGIGPALMDWAIDAARAEGAPELVLSVFVDNHRARRFYARYGFVDIGRYDFMVGDHVDEDRLMKLVL